MGGNGIWKTAALMMATAVVSLLSFLFLEGRGNVTESKVRDMIRSEGPYVEDKGRLEQRYLDDTRNLDTMRSELHELLGQVSSLRGDVQKMNGTVEALAGQRGTHGK